MKTKIAKAIAIAKGERQGDRPTEVASQNAASSGKTTYRDHTMFDVSGENFDSL